jgi:putative NIF3 family GTP cyclohydrolase 1 type 2
VRLCGEKQIAVYSAHLPLDVHPELGNNARLMRSLGFEPDGGFLDFKTIKVGVTATGDVTLEDLTKDCANPSTVPCMSAQVARRTICRIGVSTGGSGSEVAAAKAAGLDAFITGEGPHWSYTLAEELGIHVLYGGHYATETFGVKALSAHLAEQFGMEWQFIDHPTGM